MQAPRCDLVLKFLFETLASFGLFVHGTDIFLKDDWLRRCGTNYFGEPPQVGRAPGGPARVADIVSEPEGLKTELGGLKITDGVFTCPAGIANGFIFHLGDIDCGEITRAGQPGQLHGVSAVGFDPIPRFFGNQRWRHHPAVVAFLGQIAIEPGATRAGFVDEDQMVGLRLHLADELINVTLAGANGS
jgi:hypothetical protein